MRLFAAVLILVGALILGAHGVDSLQGRDLVSTEQVAKQDEGNKFASTAPALGGIAIVGGLLVLATSYRRGR